MHVHEKTLFISFDDGPHEIITPKVLDILAKHRAKATFFVLVKMFCNILPFLKESLQRDMQ